MNNYYAYLLRDLMERNQFRSIQTQNIRKILWWAASNRSIRNIS